LLLQVGWKTTREYYTFTWAPLPSDVHSDRAVQQQIQFKGEWGAGVTRGMRVPRHAHTDESAATNSTTFRITEDL